MYTMSFTRVIENFICGHCGASVIGNGYTNHCPKCLWSKDVDIDPGDRKSSCGGLMEPIAGMIEDGKEVIVHRCVKCGKEKKNKVWPDDSFDAFVLISKRPYKMK
jgi:rubrerythrin